MKIRDISKYQGDIDYNAIKGEIDALIIRVGYRGYANGIIYRDTKLDRNIRERTDRGIPFGLYFYSQATNATERILERQYIVNEAHKCKDVLFLALDMELTGSGAGRADYLRPQTRQQIADTFAKCVNDAGYQAMIYSNENYFLANLDTNSPHYINWVANWTKEPSIDYAIWQYTNKGKVPGIAKDVDLNRSEWTIDDFTGKDRTHKIFKSISDQLAKVSELVTELERKYRA